MPDHSFQDDQREEEMRRLFQLLKDETEGRSGIDAYLDIGTDRLPFELKTSSKGSVTTVRDFGPDHIVKWAKKHWLFGFYSRGGVVFKYGSPDMMAPWIREKESYIKPDFSLATLLPSKLSLSDLHAVVGRKAVYSIEDARRLHKKQYSTAKYRELFDVRNGYSEGRMLEILSDRARYIIERGSTLNNPHIPASYFDDFPIISSDHPKKLRALVRDYINRVRR